MKILLRFKDGLIEFKGMQSNCLISDTHFILVLRRPKEYIYTKEIECLIKTLEENGEEVEHLKDITNNSKGDTKELRRIKYEILRELKKIDVEDDYYYGFYGIGEETGMEEIMNEISEKIIELSQTGNLKEIEVIDLRHLDCVIEWEETRY